ncbi:MAG: cupredoxin domain-containing protein [bacterium]|nr:cupredoxin domain-containing protein [bacterium]
MRMFTFLIFLLVFLFVAPAAFAHTTTVTVRMTPDGFSPDEISVDQGSTLVFVNTDTTDRWPASNPHPVHTNYLQFDPKRAVAPGDSWSFTTERAGVFRFHDHLSPHKQGLLTVVTEEGTAPPQKPSFIYNVMSFGHNSIGAFFDSVRKNIAAFFATFQKQSPLSPTPPPTIDTTAFRNLSESEQQAYIRSLIDTVGGKKAWMYLVAAFTEKGAVVPAGGRAHDLAHFIGEQVYTKQGMTGISVCEPSFAYGCFHGFTEGAFATSLEKLPDVAAACTTVGKVNSGPWASCIHGIGHGIATFVRATDLQKALDACTKLTDGASYCYDGVFMEFSLNAPQTFYTAQDPLYPCNTLEETVRSACGRNQPAVMRNRFNLPFLSMVEACANSTDNDIRSSCLDAIGLLVGQEAAGNLSTITSRCGQIPSLDIRAICVTGASVETVFQNYSGWRQAAPAACATLPDPYTKDCTTRIQQTIKDYGGIK